MHSPTPFPHPNALAGRVLCLLLALFIAMGSLPAPLAANPLVSKFTIEDERKLGEKYHALMKAQLPIVEDPEIVGYVRDLVDRIALSLPDIPFKITTTVVKSNSVNAFAAPAGYVYIFTGLINHFEHESEVAGVIAHELAHVTQRHIAGRMENAQKVQYGMLAGMLAGIFLGAATNSEGASDASQALILGSMAAGQSAMLAYSREDEREADQVGMKYLISSGYKPMGMVDAFKTIRKQQYLSGGGGYPAYLSTHPGVDERIDYLTNRVQQMPLDITGRVDEDARFKRIQTLIRARLLDTKTSLAHFTQNPNETDCMNLMGTGIAYARLSKVALAREAFDKALACAPKDPLVAREAGRFHYEMGDPDQAAKLLQKAIIINPKDLMALFFFARLKDEQGQIDKAIEFYNRVLAALPEDWEVHYYKGLTLGKSGDQFGGYLHFAYSSIYQLNPPKAKQHLEKARDLALTPSQLEAFRKLETVYNARAEYWKK